MSHNCHFKIGYPLLIFGTLSFVKAVPKVAAKPFNSFAVLEVAPSLFPPALLFVYTDVPFICIVP